MQISENAFAALCYLVLMDHHGQGYGEAHPSYIDEKLHLLSAGYNAYSALDRDNQRRMLQHLFAWKYQVPEIVEQYENNASHDFFCRGGIDPSIS